MVTVVEVVLELRADGFINSGKVTKGWVFRCVKTGEITCQVEDRIRGVDIPVGPFSSIDEARAALLKYWDNCNAALQNEHWRPTGYP
ncbi:hypothetical protein E6B08_19360 [Pseudomonas putida]|uniref:Uncharacterized protein n=1 Tax=Pseudomonas putida TaxID=303 RepID=A0A4D6XGV3_PSEPU|nr:hypothetical protein [Pseudomonas putida]QCI13391.1 hypothetical protein E6B08_19360 [Pseudomonas putida]